MTLRKALPGDLRLDLVVNIESQASSHGQSLVFMVFLTDTDL
jgi:hypothetical protein